MKHFDPTKHSLEKYRYAQIKRDGFFVFVGRSQAGMIQYTSKNGNPFNLSSMPWHDQLVLQMPRDSLFACELFKPGEPASYISSGIAQQDMAMQLECHGIVQCRGLLHTSSVCEAKTLARRCGFEFVPYYDRHASPLSLGNWQSLESVYAYRLGECEGLVLKNQQWGNELKWKPTKTADLQVVGVEDGQGKFEGLIGSLTCATSDGTVVANVSGMTDEERYMLTEMWFKGKELQNRIVEVKYQYVGSQGKLRHPAFVRLRDDKDVADGVVE